MVHGRKLTCNSSILTHKTFCAPAAGQRCLAKQRYVACSWCKRLNYDCALLVFPLCAITRKKKEGKERHNNATQSEWKRKG